MSSVANGVRRSYARRHFAVVGAVAAPLAVVAASVAPPPTASAAPAVARAAQATTAAALLSQGKPATASSTENAGTPASAAVDGSTTTRWSSAFADPQWLQVDLGASASITQVVLNWEAAYGKAFQIQTSPDATTWTTIFSTT